MLLAAAGAAHSQSAPPALEFSFSNPGARSMGLGGAFLALADDATAAFANPAGLVQLVRPEFSLEIRTRRYSTPYTAGGRAAGDPTGNGIDTVAGLRTADSNETTSGVSFLSFVYPGARWSLALYRHQLADFALRTELDGLFADVDGGDVARFLDQRTLTELDIVTNGLSAAYQVSDSLSIGVGISYFDGSVVSRGTSYDQSPEAFWNSNSFLPKLAYENTLFSADDSDWGFSVGILWSFAERWRLGGVYRQGPEFSYELTSRAGPAHEQPDGSDLGTVFGQSIAFPDIYGAGVAYRSPSGRLTVGFEWDHVEYSVIIETLDSELVEASQATMDDVDELHLGFEYVFLDATPLIAVRAGLWRDPDHRFRYVGDEPFNRALFPAGDDVMHVSAGAGVAFRGFQIDLGLDLSDVVNSASLSAIYSF